MMLLFTKSALGAVLLLCAAASMAVNGLQTVDRSGHHKCGATDPHPKPAPIFPSQLRYNNSNPHTGPIPKIIPFNRSPYAHVEPSHRNLELRVVFTNDVHGREDAFNKMGADCNVYDYEENTCYGGVARHKTIYDALRAGHRNTLVLNAGDEFQGTMFYNRYKGNSTARFLNALGYDAINIGNHEFDDGPLHLAKFFSKLNFPVVCSNIDVSQVPELQKWVKPYVIYPEYNLALVGFITTTTEFISAPGPNVRFLDAAEAVQRVIDELHGKGIKRIIAISHNGYKADQMVARNTTGISLIVGGHSHSYLSIHPDDPNSKGPYPTTVTNRGGRTTYIVQAKKWGEYVGYLDISLTEDGDATWLEGEPIHMTMKIPQDPYFQRQVMNWRTAFDERGGFPINSISVDLDQTPCKTGECLLGNLLTDAMFEGAGDLNPDVVLMNSDGMRSGIRRGNITINHVLNVLPFTNHLVSAQMFTDYLVSAQMSGKELRDVLVGAVMEVHPADNKNVTGFIQYYGLKMEFNFHQKVVKQIYMPDPATKAIRKRTAQYGNSGENPTNSASLETTIPPPGPGGNSTEGWVPLDDSAQFIVVMNGFTAGGGDHLLAKPVQATAIDHMANVFYKYLKAHPDLSPILDGRMLLPQPEALKSALTLTALKHEGSLVLRVCYNVGPTRYQPVVRANTQSNSLVLHSMQWGVPFGRNLALAKSTGKTCINVRDDTLEEDRPMFRHSKQHRRGVVLAQGYYEWESVYNHKIPHYFTSRDTPVLCLAVVYDCIQSELGEKACYSIVTRSATSEFAGIHDRMPLMLEWGSTDWQTWLDSGRLWNPKVQAVLKTLPPPSLSEYTVSTDVGDVHQDHPGLIRHTNRPIAKPTANAKLTDFFGTKSPNGQV
ncbi:hypothetical protein H4R35_003403 [Dimargaris xerosporica]|nr:hypothetical protein H4R35_003403 [Dimargaris xerosporica]